MRLEYSEGSTELGGRLHGAEEEQDWLSGVIPENSKIHSKSCRGMPVQAQIKCLTRTLQLFGVAEPERRQQCDDRRVPGDPMLVQRVWRVEELSKLWYWRRS